MANPYRVLGAQPGQGDEVIRATYLRRVREYPPEKDPVRFAEIRAAYERVKNARRRLEFLLFEPCGGERFEEIIQEVECRSRATKWTLERIRQLFIPG